MYKFILFVMSRTTKRQFGENSLTSAEELKYIKENLSSLSMDVAEVLRNQKQMQQLIGTIQNLQKELKQKDEKILQLEERIDDLEQYTRKDDIVIAGLQTRHLSYSRAAIRGDDAHGENASSTEVDFWKCKSLTFLTKIVLNSLPIILSLVIRLENHEMEKAHDTCKIYKSKNKGTYS